MELHTIASILKEYESTINKISKQQISLPQRNKIGLLMGTLTRISKRVTDINMGELITLCDGYMDITIESPLAHKIILTEYGLLFCCTKLNTIEGDGAMDNQTLGKIILRYS